MAMEILTAIIPTIIDYTVRPLGRQVSYVIFCKSYLKDLRSAWEKFEAVKQRMKHEVEQVERKVNKKVEADVRNWQTEADEISREAEALLDDEGRAKTKCLYICPNLISYHQLSRKSTKLVRKIEEHENKKEFASISCNVAVEDISAIASDEYMAFESRTSMVKKIIKELKIPGINKIGVYGLPGVGKTTLAKEVYREAVKEKLFDDVVIILNVKEKEDKEKIHKEITETLGMDIDECENMGKGANLLWEQGREEKLFDNVVIILNLKGKKHNETIQKAITKKLSMDVDESKDMETRANFLRARIKDGKTLVILDDVLERIDFEAVGLVGVPTCSLLLTSRDQTVLCEMGMQKCFQLDLLSEKETWMLFEKMAGDVVKDDRIRKVATQLARRCGGLPVSVVTVARALREEDSRLEVWKDALRRFKIFDKDGPAEKAKFAIEWSYNRLKGDELRPLFLLCGVIAGGSYSISLSDLFKYSMGLGLIKNVDTMEDARNSLHALTAKLKNSCLLLDGYDHSTVRMHELIRDVAVRIASNDQKAFPRAYEEEVKEWPTEDFLKKCTMMSFSGCKIPRLPEVPWECPELKLLVLENDDIGDSEEIPSKFFEGMKELKVLVVTKLSIRSLPPSLQFLKHLYTLCLDGCELVDITLVGQLTNLKILSLLKSKIKELPKEIGQLTRLQLLDLTGCSELVLISRGVISSLTRLEDLRMGIKSFKQWEGEGPTSGGSNATISELKHLAELTALDMHVLDANLLPANLFSDKLERYTILIGDCWEYPNTYGTSSNMLKLQLTRRNQFDQGIKLLVERCEQLYLDGKESGNIIFFLFDSDAVKQLKCLHVQNNDEVTYVVNSIGWSYSQNAFQKLKSLTLWNLPKLIGFSSNDKKLTTDTEADEIVLEDEIGGPPKLFNNEKVMMPNLTTLTVHQCDSLRFLFSSSMAKCLGQLENLEISNCQIMEEIVRNEENTDDMFDKLNRLELQHLPNLARFSSRSYIKFPSLVYLNLDDCTKLETFIFDAKSENITTNKEERNIELFDEKVGFPSLEILRIWDLPKLKTIFHNQRHSDSFGKLRIIDVRRCHSLINIFGPSIMGRLNALEKLQIEQCQSLQMVYDSSSTTQLNDFGTDADEIVLEEEVGGPPRLFSNGEVMMPNLTTLSVDQCDSLRFLFSSSMAKCFGQLENLKISNCQIMEEIVGNEENTNDMFDKLSHLVLQHLPNLARFSSRSYIKFPSLVYLNLDDCTKLETFIFDAKSENITTNKEERNIELFDEKVGFPSLEILCIWDLPKLKTIFHNQLHSDSFGKLRIMDVRRCHNLIYIFGPSIMGRLNALERLQIEQCQSLQVVYDSSSTTQLNGFECPNLNSVCIDSCESLKNVFLASVAKDLKQLNEFSVKNCGLMEEIVVKEEGIVVKEEGPQMAYEEFEFPKVTTMIFDNMPQLRSFYPGLHVSNWPSLNELKLIKCGGVEIFAAEFSTYQDKFKLGHPMPTEQPFFLIEKGKSFLNLEVLVLNKNMEIWHEPYGPLPTELLSKLNTICFATSHPKSDVFFENLQNIEMLVVLSAPWKELFVYDHQGSSRGETHEVETLPRVKVLQLTEMPELIHLGMENSQPGGPVFPNLEVLFLEKCGRLENLASTLIPFRNLICLVIHSCHGLQYLIPYSVAKNLQQLLRLEVVSCQIMVEIVASNEDDPENEITFSCLQCLKLSGLPSLQGFCRGNCIFKVPSFKTLFVEDCQLIDLKISSDGLLQSDPRPGRLQIAK